MVQSLKTPPFHLIPYKCLHFWSFLAKEGLNRFEISNPPFHYTISSLQLGIYFVLFYTSSSVNFKNHSLLFQFFFSSSFCGYYFVYYSDQSSVENSLTHDIRSQVSQPPLVLFWMSLGLLMLYMTTMYIYIYRFYNITTSRDFWYIVLWIDIKKCCFVQIYVQK